MGRPEPRLLGDPRVSVGGREGTLRPRKALALLAYLAAEGGMHRRDKLADLLWPGSKGKDGRTTLGSALARIRRALGEGQAGFEALARLGVALAGGSSRYQAPTPARPGDASAGSPVAPAPRLLPRLLPRLCHAGAIPWSQGRTGAVTTPSGYRSVLR